MKTVDTVTLKRLAARARGLGLNRLLSKSAERALDPRGQHILSQVMLHGDASCVRCNLVLAKLRNRDEPYQGCLDFALDDWNALPEPTAATV